MNKAIVMNPDIHTSCFALVKPQLFLLGIILYLATFQAVTNLSILKSVFNYLLVRLSVFPPSRSSFTTELLRDARQWPSGLGRMKITSVSL